MSFEGKYKTKIKFVNEEYMKEAIAMMVRDLELNLVDVRNFTLENMHHGKVYVKGLCFKVPGANNPVDLYINKNNELEMQCGEYDRTIYKKYLERIEKQFYPAIVITHKTGTPVKYDKETEKLTMMVAR
jgi:hypothetical protein